MFILAPAITQRSTEAVTLVLAPVALKMVWNDFGGTSLAVPQSARFHRSEAGNGLNDFAKRSLTAARLLEKRIRFWDITPKMDLLSDRSPNEAYLAARPGELYALYFTNGGSVTVDFSDAKGSFEVTWISVSNGIVVQKSARGAYRPLTKEIQGGRLVTIGAPYKGGWVAAIVKK